jgi:hypothetical protein
MVFLGSFELQARQPDDQGAAHRERAVPHGAAVELHGIAAAEVAERERVARAVDLQVFAAHGRVPQYDRAVGAAPDGPLGAGERDGAHGTVAEDQEAELALRGGTADFVHAVESGPTARVRRLGLEHPIIGRICKGHRR